MFEYEYRLVVQCPDYETVLKKIIQQFNVPYYLYTYTVIYIPPHFRYKNQRLEWKKKLSSVVVYFDELWLNLIESEEIDFHNWSKSKNCNFIKKSSYYQNIFLIEHRQEISFPSYPYIKIYGFCKNDLKGLVFELELGESDERKDLRNLSQRLSFLEPFKDILHFFKNLEPFSYTLSDCKRKPVKPTSSKTKFMAELLVAPKYDGVFGFVYSFKNEICEVWEGNIKKNLKGFSIGNGIVFGAEKMSDGTVILLDVYQVRGSKVICSKKILMEFLPSLTNAVGIPPHYKIQMYQNFKNNSKELLAQPSLPHTDGYILHNTGCDTIYKLKTNHTIDLLYRDGFLIYPTHQQKIEQQLENNVIYECTIEGKPLKKRMDRFIGNTHSQIKKNRQASKK